MAKTKTASNLTPTKKTVEKKSVGPTELELCLHAPGMDSLLRAGIGGLASVLEAMEGEVVIQTTARWSVA